jgi:hypothetical protein
LHDHQNLFRVYVQVMRQRLTANKSCLDLEAFAVGRIGHHGKFDTHLFTRMITERNESDAKMELFNGHVHTRLEGWAMRLCSRSWFDRLVPFDTSLLLKLLPPNYHMHMRAYQLFMRQQTNKHIVWVPSEGQAVVEVSFAKSKHPFSFGLSTYQMLILLLFNHHSSLSVKDILRLTNIPKEELPPHLLSLAHPRVNVLLKRPGSRRLGEHDRFKLVSKFQSHWRTLKVPLLKCTASICGSGWEQRQKESLARMNLQKTTLAVVRLLAAKGADGIVVSDLCDTVFTSLRANFVNAGVNDIDDVITSLHQKGWVHLYVGQRDNMDIDTTGVYTTPVATKNWRTAKDTLWAYDCVPPVDEASIKRAPTTQNVE